MADNDPNCVPLLAPLQSMGTTYRRLGNLVSWPVISKSTIYDFTIEASYEIMVHYGFEYCGLITHHSSSRLGNCMSPALYGLVQPSIC
jgi:hypothetical protein